MLRLLVLAVLLALRWAPPAVAGNTVQVYFAHPGGKSAAAFASHNRHPLLDGALIPVEWSDAEPRRGHFDWSRIERDLSAWAAGGKPAILKIAPYNQRPRDSSPHGDNSQTPSWVYEAGVPRVTFSGGGVAAGQKVSLPRVWDPAFYPVYEEYIAALASRFGQDTRVGGFKVGIGHLGNLMAQASKEGTSAFRAAGWTLDVWERHCTRVIDVYRKHFPTQRLMVRMAGGFLRDTRVKDNLDAARRIVRYAAERGVSVLFGGIDPETSKFDRTGVRELVSYLGTLSLPPAFAIGLTDDWPLWVPPHRSKKCPGPTCGRDVQGLTRELRTVLDLWDGIQRKHPLFLVLLEPETAATDAQAPGFDRAVYDVVSAFVRDPSGPVPAGSGDGRGEPAPRHDRRRRR